MITTTVSFVVVLGVLIFIHELGHFLAAKWAGIRVERFSLGFPPRMIGKKIGDTDYCISWIPLGGYVKMAGMIDESMDTKIEGKPDEFMSKPVWQRAIVIGAGPVMNLLLAVGVFAGLIYFSGIPEPIPVINALMENMPAQEAGLQLGDRIVKIDGETIDNWEELTTIINRNAGKQLQIEWERDGELLSTMVVPKLDSTQNIGLIGIRPDSQMRQASLFEATRLSGMLCWRITAEVGSTVMKLFRGKESIKEGLAGPLQIAQLAGDFARQGLAALLNFMAIISLQLGLLNLLPIPVLDGGHLVFLGMETALRRPVSIKLRLVVQQIGMVLLLALMAFIIFNDIQKITQ